METIIFFKQPINGYANTCKSTLNESREITKKSDLNEKNIFID